MKRSIIRAGFETIFQSGLFFLAITISEYCGFYMLSISDFHYFRSEAEAGVFFVFLMELVIFFTNFVFSWIQERLRVRWFLVSLLETLGYFALFYCIFGLFDYLGIFTLSISNIWYYIASLFIMLLLANYYAEYIFAHSSKRIKYFTIIK